MWEEKMEDKNFAFYGIGQSLQNSIINLGIYNTEFLKLVASKIKEEHFSSKYASYCWKIISSYFKSFGVSPEQHFFDELQKFVMESFISDSEIDLIVEFVGEVEKEKPNRDYVLKNINTFIKRRSLEVATIEFAQLVKANKFEEAEDRIMKALREGIVEVDSGIDYFDTSGLYKRLERPEYLMGFGIDYFDRVLQGLKRGWLVSWLGIYKGKKSWGLIHLGRQALLQGLKVAHFTNEMTSEEVRQRYDRSFGALTDDKTEEISYLVIENGEVKRQTTIRPSVFDLGIVRGVLKAVKRFGGKLRIKGYGMGECSVEDLEAQLDYWKTFEDFIPDVVITDYADIMRLEKGSELRHRINDTWIKLKSLAVRRNVLIITASQATTDVIKKSKVTKADWSEDKRKVGNIDLGIGICQTEEEDRLGIARLYIVANRHSVENIQTIIGMSISIGQFCLWSVPYSASLIEEIKIGGKEIK